MKLNYITEELHNLAQVTETKASKLRLHKND